MDSAGAGARMREPGAAMKRTFNAIKVNNSVREALLYEYARLIADARFDLADDGLPAGYPDGYWPFLIGRYRLLSSGRLSRSSHTRQNVRAALAVDHCAYCAGLDRLQWDHLIPRSSGGADEFDNLVRSCAACNVSKSDRPVFHWAHLVQFRLARWVRGKHLKLVFDAHERAGTLGAELPADWSRTSIESMVFAGRQP